MPMGIIWRSRLSPTVTTLRINIISAQCHRRLLQGRKMYNSKAINDAFYSKSSSSLSRNARVGRLDTGWWVDETALPLNIATKLSGSTGSSCC